jgi:hypothetical protein
MDGEEDAVSYLLISFGLKVVLCQPKRVETGYLHRTGNLESSIVNLDEFLVVESAL